MGLLARNGRFIILATDPHGKNDDSMVTGNYVFWVGFAEHAMPELHECLWPALAAVGWRR